MNVGVGNIICEAICDLCGFSWIAVVEVDYIDFNDKVEYKKPQKLQCKKCSNNTQNITIIND